MNMAWHYPNLALIQVLSHLSEFGPIRIDFDRDKTDFTLIMSKIGIPSVMQTIRSISASIASNIASAQMAAVHRLR